MSSTLRYIPYFEYIRDLLGCVKSAGAEWDHCSLQLALQRASFTCLLSHHYEQFMSPLVFEMLLLQY